MAACTSSLEAETPRAAYRSAAAAGEPAAPAAPPEPAAAATTACSARPRRRRGTEAAARCVGCSERRAAGGEAAATLRAAAAGIAAASAPVQACCVAMARRRPEARARESVRPVFCQSLAPPATMAGTTVVVQGIRGLRGTPGVSPEHAIGEEQLRAFFAQDGASEDKGRFGRCTRRALGCSARRRLRARTRARRRGQRAMRLAALARWHAPGGRQGAVPVLGLCAAGI